MPAMGHSRRLDHGRGTSNSGHIAASHQRRYGAAPLVDRLFVHGQHFEPVVEFWPQGSPATSFGASSSAATSSSLSPFAAETLRASPNTPLGVSSLNDPHRLSGGARLTS